MTPRRRTTAGPAWSRTKLTGLLATALAAVGLLTVGLILAVYYTLNSRGRPPTPRTSSAVREHPSPPRPPQRSQAPSGRRRTPSPPHR